MKTSLVVITGGEPFLQWLDPFVARCNDKGLRVQIETAGTLFPPLLDLWLARTLDGRVTVVCSPKTGAINPMVATLCRDYKYIIRKGETASDDGLPTKSTQHEGEHRRICRPPRLDAQVWLQPCEEYVSTDEGPIPDYARTHENLLECSRLAMRFGYRVSFQLHKVLGLP
jgi:organic radical activating enzyme